MATGELRGAFDHRAIEAGPAQGHAGEANGLGRGDMLLTVTDPDAQPAPRVHVPRREKELLVLDAAEQAGERADLQAGMAKLFATETAEECALDAMRIYGGAGFEDNPVERLYRDAPLLILGEGPTRSSTSSSPGGSWRRGARRHRPSR